MHQLRLISIIAWIALPTVMYSGYALLGFLTHVACPYTTEFKKLTLINSRLLL